MKVITGVHRPLRQKGFVKHKKREDREREDNGGGRLECKPHFTSFHPPDPLRERFLDFKTKDFGV